MSKQSSATLPRSRQYPGDGGPGLNKDTQVFRLMSGLGHESVLFCSDPKTGLRAIIAIHSTALGPALGGVRMWPYPSEAAALLTRYVRGHRSVVASDLEQASQMAQHLMPQTVIVDQACEELDPAGLGALAQEWQLPNIPFVMCPLPGEEPLRQRLAVDGYLIKPVSRQSLWDVLRQFGNDVDKVLVVDDDQDFVLMISRLLENNPVRRYQVISAYSGHEALAMIRHHQPDLVLLDLMLPDIDGTQVIERLRSKVQRTHMPIVIVSAQDELDHQLILKGPLTISKADGLKVDEVIQWVQAVAYTSTRCGRPDKEDKQVGEIPDQSGGSDNLNPLDRQKLRERPVRHGG